MAKPKGPPLWTVDAGAGGRERTVAQYRELFAHHGLRLDQVMRTASPTSLLVVTRG